MTVCRWLPDLRVALAALYGNPEHPGATGVDASQAHDFLMRIQSTNKRRKVHSLQQKHKDMNVTTAPTVDASLEMSEAIMIGSFWLPCLILVAQVHETGDGLRFSASSTERLFCAQTLLHRLRRIKIVEAIDLEFEFFLDVATEAQLLQMYNNMDHYKRLVPSYQELSLSMNPLVAQILTTYEIELTSVEREARCKAEMTLLTLSCVAYIAATEHEVNMPFLETLGHCLATIVLRLRFHPNATNTDGFASRDHMPSLVNLFNHTLEAVYQALPTSESRQTSML